MGVGIGVLLLLIYVLLQCCYGADLLNRIAPVTSPDVQEEAVRQLIERVVGKRSARLFDVEVNKVLAERSYQVNIVFRINNSKFSSTSFFFHTVSFTG